MSDMPAGEQKPEPVSSPAQPPELDPNTVVDIGGETPTVGALAESHRELQRLKAEKASAPAIEPDRLEKLELLERALEKNDPEAQQQLLTRYGPAPVQTPEDRMGAMAAQLEATQKRLEELSTIAAQGQKAANVLTKAQEDEFIRSQIQAAKDKLPMLAQHPSALERVNTRMANLYRMAQDHGIDTTKSDANFHRNMLGNALQMAENDITHDLSWGKALTTQPTSQPVVAVDDQSQPRRNATTGGLEPGASRPARLQLRHGAQGIETIDLTRGQPVEHTGGIPSQMVQTPSGVPVAPMEQPPSGPITKATFLERLRQRGEEL